MGGWCVSMDRHLERCVVHYQLHMVAIVLHFERPEDNLYGQISDIFIYLCGSSTTCTVSKRGARATSDTLHVWCAPPTTYLERVCHARAQLDGFRKVHSIRLIGRLLVLDFNGAGGYIFQHELFYILCARQPVSPLQLVGAVDPKPTKEIK